MGDVGALALGGALGTIAVIVRQEIVLGDHGRHLRRRGAVGDGAGDLLQVHQEALRRGPAHPARWRRCTTTSRRAAGSETQVVVRFWIITMLLCLVGPGELEAAVSDEAPARTITCSCSGLGESGLAMARWCARHGAQVTRVGLARGAAAAARRWREHVPRRAVRRRRRSTPALLEGVQLRAARARAWRRATSASRRSLRRARRPACRCGGELDLFARALADLKAERGYAPQVLAITGTNGKTTTTALTALLVERAGKRVAVAGNIGPTLLDTLAAAARRRRAAGGLGARAVELPARWRAGLRADAPPRCSTSRRTTSTGTATWQAYAAAKARIFGNAAR